MKSEILSLFPTPIQRSQYFLDLTDSLDYIDTIEYRSNDTNQQSVDTFILNSDPFKKIKKFIDCKLLEYANNILATNHKLNITQSWINRSASGGSHKIHNHPNSIVSGVFYLQLENDMPQISFYKDVVSQFHLSQKYITDFTTDYFSLLAESGTLLLFPSHLKHAVPQNKSTKERISLSFNTFCSESLGNIESLTYLPL
jgi:uncharacterized protein (TIGR02466 family)